MMRSALVLVVPLVVLAGCLGGAGPDPDGDTSTTADGMDTSDRPSRPATNGTHPGPGMPDLTEPNATLPAIHHRGCSTSFVFAPMEADRARSLLPEGFEPDPIWIGGAGVPETASVVVATISCAGATHPDGSMDDTALTEVLISVDPPATHDAGAASHYAILEVVVPRDKQADTWRSLGVPVTVGTVDIRVQTAESPETTVIAGTTRTADGTVGVASVGTPSTSFSSFTVRQFAIRDGELEGTVDIQVHPGRRGTGRAQITSTPGATPLPAPAEPAFGVHQQWDDDALSYTWRPIDPDPGADAGA